MKSLGRLVTCAILVLESSVVLSQTTAGTSATIVVPVIAQTSSFSSEVTIYNPNATTITVNPVFYDAQNTASPGPKSCTSLSLGANITKTLTVASQCALPSGSNFGLLVLTEATGANRFYGYARTQTPQGVGFSTEGFPIENFNDQVQHAMGLKRVAAAGGLPAYQTNCFVATLGDAVSYELRLFDGATNAQLGSTLSGSLAPFQQFRYLDVFAAAGVAAGNKTNVRAQFTNLTGSKKKLIGFCTVQENTNLSADFRIAKSYGGTPQNAFVQGGNAFGTAALLGPTDDQPLDLLLGNVPIMRFEPTTNTYLTPNIVGGDPNNSAASAFPGQTIAGGGTSLESVSCFASTRGGAVSCSNQTSNYFATVSGGDANLASGNSSTVAGGSLNAASGDSATVSGGIGNVASGDWATVPGGLSNVASGKQSFAAGFLANANQDGCVLFAYWQVGGGADCFGTSYQFRIMGTHGLSIDYGTRLAGGNGTRWAVIGDTVAGKTIATWTGAYLSDGGTWVNASDRALKTDFQDVDALQILAKVDRMPVTHWRYKNQPNESHLGPVAQDFYAAFGLGGDDKHIATVDEAGVALAAIQGLHQLLQNKDAQIASQHREIEAMREELDAVKRAVAKLMRDAPIEGQGTP